MTVTNETAEGHGRTNGPIPPLRPNYTTADFAVGQTVLLRCDGATGVPRYMDGSRASVVKATPRRLRVRLGADGEAGRRVLSVTPNQVSLIVE